jgi:uncharacterized protein (TIGR04255 family)
VAFEIRFTPKSDLSTKLLLEANKKFSNIIRVANLEGLKIPEEVKNHQPDLNFIPSYKVISENFSLLISNGSLVVLANCLTEQYQGWDKFKLIIKEITDILNENKALEGINRFSLKYTNLFEEDYLNKIKLSFDIRLGNKNITSKENFNLKSEIEEDNILISTSILSKIGLENTCDITGNKTNKVGLLLVIDIIKGFEVYKEFDVAPEIEKLHTKVSKQFLDIYPDFKGE